MNNRYYTPTIEEFHVGFEFEKLDDREAYYADDSSRTNWHRFKYGLNSIRLSQLPSHLGNKTIRVKHLDIKDIESLGFKYIDYVPQGDSDGRWYDSFFKDNVIINTAFVDRKVVIFF